MSNYVELSNLTKIYPTPRGEAVIVKDFNLKIQKGEFVTLIGHSGCGKSTVLSMLMGLNDLSGGAIILGQWIVGSIDLDVVAIETRSGEGLGEGVEVFAGG